MVALLIECNPEIPPHPPAPTGRRQPAFPEAAPLTVCATTGWSINDEYHQPYHGTEDIDPSTFSQQ